MHANTHKSALYNELEFVNTNIFAEVLQLNMK